MASIIGAFQRARLAIFEKNAFFSLFRARGVSVHGAKLFVSIANIYCERGLREP